ncbi:hypothetical protein FRC11_007143, partial [Ceratobasidium sp. 423]
RLLAAQPVSALVITSEPASPEPLPTTADTPTVTTAVGAIKITNVAWSRLLVSLQTLRNTSGVFGPLASAADVLLDCFIAIETAGRNRQDYEDLATELAALSESLAQYFKDMTSNVVSKCVSSVAMSYDNTIRVWNASNGTLIAGPFEGHTGCIRSISFSPDSTRIVSGSEDHAICLRFF